MKTAIAIFIALFMASANATTESSSRKRTSAVYKSSSAAEDETFDPYLGMEHRKLHAGHSMSMSMSHSMSMSVPEVTARYVFCPRPHIHELFAYLNHHHLIQLLFMTIILTFHVHLLSFLNFCSITPTHCQRLDRGYCCCSMCSGGSCNAPLERVRWCVVLIFLVGFPWYLQFDTFGWMMHFWERWYSLFILLSTYRTILVVLVLNYPEFLF